MLLCVSIIRLYVCMADTRYGAGVGLSWVSSDRGATSTSTLSSCASGGNRWEYSSLASYVCVCVCERERERNRGIMSVCTELTLVRVSYGGGGGGGAGILSPPPPPPRNLEIEYGYYITCYWIQNFPGEGCPQTTLVGTHTFHTLLSSCYHPVSPPPTQNPVWNPVSH